ncbi:MAG: DUF6782 family putative metallopeptidase [Gemmatimonadota bacterium]
MASDGGRLTLDVMGFRVRVSFSRRRPAWVPRDAKHGCFDPGRPRIWVDPRDYPAEQLDTLWHELAHLALAVEGVDLERRRRPGEKPREEAVAEAVARVFPRLLADNPRLPVTAEGLERWRKP